VKLAALAGLSDPRPFSLRQLGKAADAKRREEWDKIAFLRLDLRRAFAKSTDELSYVDFNPILTKEQRAKIKAEERARKVANAPKIGALELFETLRGATRK